LVINIASTYLEIAISQPDAFYDIIKGNNNCNTSPTCCQYGYAAAEKWDPVSGLGSINHGILMEALMDS